MTADDLRARVANITPFKRGGVRAPHKPLLVLYALARFAEGIERLPFKDTERPLIRLLDDFGRPRDKANVPYSFWRLPNDGLWTITGDENIRLTAPPANNWFLTDARRDNPVGRFPDEVAALLRAQPSLISEIAYTLLDAHFPPTLHEDILTAIGLDPEQAARGQKKRAHRDPAFRDRVLEAYGYRCAVCRLGLRVGHQLVAIEAAHVKWHSAGGPDDVTNGLALCTLHHKLLDAGAFSLDPASNQGRTLIVSSSANGGDGFHAWLDRFHRQPIAEPTRTEYRVSEPFLDWHHKQVFKGRPRT